MITRLKNSYLYVRGILLDNESPVWFTIVVGALAAVGTYFISPSLNYQFELKKIQVGHLVDTAKNLNDDMIEFQSKARSFNNALVKSHSDIEEKRADLLDLVAKIQWRLIDARSVVSGVSIDESKVISLRDALTEFKSVAERVRDANDQDVLLKASVPVLARADALLSAVYKRTGFTKG